MTENGKPKFEGEAVWLGGQEYVLPSLSVGQAKKLWPEILELNKGVTVDALPQKRDEIVKIIHAAISRNYPEMTIETMEDFVDLGNMRRLMMIVSGQSGMKPRPGEEADAVTKSIGSESTEL
jgi:hypothetical protein